MRFIILLGVAILLSGCGTTTNYYTQTVQSWNGSNLKDLNKRWGKPDQIVNTPHGETVYLYKTESYQRTTTPNGPSTGISYTADGRPVVVTRQNFGGNGNRNMTVHCFTYFIADPKGKIVEVKNSGGSCFANTSFIERMGNPANMPQVADKHV